ncbi:photosystem I reaction center subunit XI [Chamaesiphon minutus]|uniref:Photosystem I reaction center subunit XI n=1 Tax=Chamaesiphon minutus (strain ATCC 27169 / PCC 6605) TaxID=1173020 RepID=K9UL39_CHAP6|nr:photosystem I reaction center subunit XI [Chamaesiphon minutus]AFY95792.1 Photosystem I reaction centre subunit XI [Chamaesiphon minutus PCC 6605]
MTTFVEKIDQSKNNPRDPRNNEVVLPDFDPQGSNLATPINSSKLAKAIVNNFSAYRQGLSPMRRGIEVGLAHGYWQIGPFFEFNPLRYSELGAVTALLSDIGLVVISAAAIVIYAATNPPPPIATLTVPNPPDVFASTQGWNTYATGFLIGGIGGAVIAYFIVANNDVFQNFLRLIGL